MSARRTTDAFFVHNETEKLSGGVSNASLTGVESDAVGDADSEKFLEVGAKLVEVVGETEPIVHVVSQIREGLGGVPVGALGLRSGVLLSKR